MNDNDSSNGGAESSEDKDDDVLSASSQAESQGTRSDKNKQSFSTNKNLIGVGVAAVVIILGGLFLIMRSNSEPSGTREQVSPRAQNQQTASQQDVLPEATEESQDSTEAGNVVEFTIEGSPFKFVPNQLAVKQGDTVRITFKNIEGLHDFNLPDFDVATKRLAAGNQETVEFVANKTGEFEYYCSVGNHRDMGMFGTLIVE